MRQFLANYIKNIGGWSTKRKIICFAVDDYGNIYLNNSKSLNKLKQSVVPLNGRFDKLDALDTYEDYSQLFSTLNSVKDKHQNPAVFTTYALPANIDFEKVLMDKKHFEYELLPLTYEKLAQNNKAYNNTWKILKEGIDSKLIKPQFHGREHLNVLLFETLLKEENEILMTNLKYRSYASIPKIPNKPTIAFNQAFAFWNESEVHKHKKIIADGLKRFEEVYGYKSITFTPPAQQLHPKLFPFLEKQGIKAIDKPRSNNRHLGENKFEPERNKLGIQKNENHVTIVRNAVFEPNSNKNIDWVEFAFKQIQAAFRMNKPAIVSSHRVNFCGLISPDNRKDSLKLLEALLLKIVQKYPDVEFLSVDELANEIIKTSSTRI